MRLRPFDDRVLIRQAEAPTESNEVLIPDNQQVAPAEGVVVAVGPGLIKPDHHILKAIFEMLKWVILTWYHLKKSQQGDPQHPVPDFSAEYNPMQCKVGDYVTYGKYAGTNIVFNGEKLIMVRQNDVFMVDDEKTEALKAAKNS